NDGWFQLVQHFAQPQHAPRNSEWIFRSHVQRDVSSTVTVDLGNKFSAGADDGALNAARDVFTVQFHCAALDTAFVERREQLNDAHWPCPTIHATTGRRNFAGLPTTTELSGTSFSTTLPMPTRLREPIFTPLRTLAFAPM